MHGVPMGSRMSDDQLNFHLLLQEDLEEWMKILACASFDYMKLMVVELQHQLAELEEAEERAAAAHAAEATEATEATADGAGGGGEGREVGVLCVTVLLLSCRCQGFHIIDG